MHRPTSSRSISGAAGSAAAGRPGIGRQPPRRPVDMPAGSPTEEPDREKAEPAYPSLKRRSAEERADAIIDDLKEAILNPGRLDGSTGMAYGDWAKIAHKKITRAVKEAEASAAFRELMSANRIGGLCMRIGFLLLAALAAFGGFWFGAVFIWDTYGPAWGTGAVMSSIGLSFAFVVAGLMLSGQEIDTIRKQVRDTFNLDD